jgi:hypothetical protein
VRTLPSEKPASFAPDLVRRPDTARCKHVVQSAAGYRPVPRVDSFRLPLSIGLPGRRSQRRPRHRLLGGTLIRDVVALSGAVAAISFGMQGTTTGSCLIASPNTRWHCLGGSDHFVRYLGDAREGSRHPPQIFRAIYTPISAAIDRC